MFLDRLNQRIGITLLVSLLLHFFILSLFQPGRFSRPGKNLMLTDVEYINMSDKPFGVREPAKPKPRPREVVDTAPKTTETQAETTPPEKEEEPEEAGDPNALPGDPGGGGKFFLPYYAVEQMPAFQNKVAPVYPEAARKLERSSQVILEAYIDAEGIVRKIRIVRSGGDPFDQAAIRALEVSKFSPAFINGKPVPVKILIPYVFSLEK
jgi:TonB family protein